MRRDIMLPILILFIISFYISLVIYVVCEIARKEYYKNHVKCNREDSCKNFRPSWCYIYTNGIWCPYCPINNHCNIDKHEYIECKNKK